jgi:putative endonuclease
MAYSVYIITNRSKTIYVGVTNNLLGRVGQHKEKRIPGFTKKYNLDRLVYYELFDAIRAAIRREKQIKGWLRARKIALVESVNPGWEDLTGTLY